MPKLRRQSILEARERMRYIMKKYLPRIADKLLLEALESAGAVLIEGPKWCGKTRTASEYASSELHMQDPDKSNGYLQTANTKPSLLLKGENPRLIDEWQVAPVLWDAVRYEVDLRGEEGQFILTGSAVPILDELTTHTGTGRISRIRMRPMSLYESKESNGQISLGDLFSGGKEVEAISSLSVEDIGIAIVRGGWPTAVTAKAGVVEKRVRDYVEAIINIDISRVDGVEKNPNKVRALLRSLARNISTEASYKTLKGDMEGGEAASVSYPTLLAYKNALERIFVTEDLEAWNPSIRSKAPLRTTPKRHFVDPSIATALLGINQNQLLLDFETFGFLFESLCIRDLRVYADLIDGRVYHYRDKSNLECDAIIVLRDGRWGAIEIKLGSFEFDKAASNLKALKENINTEKMNEPSFLMILSGTEFGYAREDGIIVVPIGCLRG